MNKLGYELIGSVYKSFLRPFLFNLDPEDVHDRFTQIGNNLGQIPLARSLARNLIRYDSERLSQTIYGINFTNPVGLSEGFDKDANLIQILPEIGFGFTQVGSVTLHPYEGNPPPRLYRLPKSKAIVVNYGLKSDGADKVIEKLSRNNINAPISISIAKTNSIKNATDSEAIDDYYQTLKKCVKADVGDFYTINISCPNTYGGEPFTTPKRLDVLLRKLKTVKTSKPIFVKMPINLPWKDFDNLLQIIIKHKLNGVIIGNLQKDRSDPSIKDEIPKSIKGGISGLPTRKLSNQLIGKTYKKYGDKLVIIGVGGIFDAYDAYEKIKLGASLVQLITGMIYEGPQLPAQINLELDNLLIKDGYENISQAIGSAI